MMKNETAIALVCFLVLAACAESNERDAGIDGAVVERDAGSMADAGMAVDAGPPPVDTGPVGPPDQDSDGVPDGEDCDPADGSVGRTGEMDCANACGDGTASCTDGVWADCDAPVDCLCGTEGATRVSNCGMCGQQSEVCDGTMWEIASDCLNQGECTPGTFDEERTILCAERQRICQVDCSWGEWAETAAPGECEPFRQQCSGVDNSWACSPECMRVENMCCSIVGPRQECCSDPRPSNLYVPTTCFD